VSSARDVVDDTISRDDDDKERDDKEHRGKSESDIVRDLKNDLR